MSAVGCSLAVGLCPRVLSSPSGLSRHVVCVWWDQEEKRQSKAIRARQLSEKQDVQIAHNMQFAEFNASWDKYMQEYDQMAQVLVGHSHSHLTHTRLLLPFLARCVTHSHTHNTYSHTRAQSRSRALIHTLQSTR